MTGPAFHQEPSRPTPRLDPHQMKTYTVASPLETHFRPGTCEEAECGAMRNGWRTVVYENTALGTRQAAFMRGDRSRKHIELPGEAGGTEFVFEAGQPCFNTIVVDGQVRQGHSVPLDRPELYLVRPGDWRVPVRPDEIRVHSGADAWTDDLQSHTQTFIDQAAKG